MMRYKFLLVFLVAAFFLWVIAAGVLAQEEQSTEVPPPYAGEKNPFSWTDTSAQENGKGLYKQYCLGCHGIKGGNLSESDFSAADYPRSMEEREDLHFWILSEGRLDRGMPPYKSSLSDEQRWQVLTYIWSLGTAVDSSDADSISEEPPAKGVSGTILLTIPEQAQVGQQLTFTAVFQNTQGQPVRNALIKFFIKVDFFASGLMEIGDAPTKDGGMAIFEYIPRQTGDLKIVARYEAIETIETLTVTEAVKPFYQAEAGIRLPAPGVEVFIGPASALEPGKDGTAPMTGLRLPGGILSWLLFVVGAVIIIWGVYALVMYRIFRIPVATEIGEINTRLVPLIGVAVVVVLGALMVLMVITGPYSHSHLLR